MNNIFFIFTVILIKTSAEKYIMPHVYIYKKYSIVQTHKKRLGLGMRSVKTEHFENNDAWYCKNSKSALKVAFEKVLFFTFKDWREINTHQ